MRRAKIVATIGPSSESAERLKALIEAGMDVARINMSHGAREPHGEVIARIREVSSAMGKPVAVMVDLSGPKIRTGRVCSGGAQLSDGAVVRIITDEVQGNSSCFSVNYDDIAAEVRPGDRVLIGDGEIELEVLETAPAGLVAKVVHGGLLGDHKGVNLPGGGASLPSITEKDQEDLKFAVRHGVDVVAQSFVRNADDCRKARELISGLGSSARLIAKIEKPEAFLDISRILEVADGVMVARGDLAVETSPERVPVLQKRMIKEALLAQKTVITATQMLQSMIECPRPTRAEASDVANAILDGTDALMLSAETAVGKYPVESVSMMDRIVRSTEAMTLSGAADMGGWESLRFADTMGDAARNKAFGQKSGSIGRAVAEAAVFAAEEVGCRLIVVFTQSGHMARRVAAIRPRQQIVALTSAEQTRRQLSMTWGVQTYMLPPSDTASDQVLRSGDQALISYNLAKPGEKVVLMAGAMNDIAISTSMKLHRVGQFAGK
jgi:pyruvate kinase